MNVSDLSIPDDADHGARLAHARWADPEYVADRYTYREGDIWLGRCPHDPNRAIGHRDDRHVFLCAETRSGKGRAFLVNNQVLWPGSLIAIDPKGEAALIAAARRGPGSAHCEGLGQEVYILDPSGMDLPPELDRFRAHFNPLAALRANDPQLVEKTRRVAKAICEVRGGEATVWDERGRNLVANVIRHVVTAPRQDFEEYGLPRDLTTVRSLILAGHRGLAKRTDEHHRAKAAAEGKIARPADPFDLLFEQMAANPACNGEIALGAHDMLSYLRGHVEGFQSVRSAAARQLEFLAGYGMCKTVTATGARDDGTGETVAYPRTFQVQDLKNSCISVFLCVKQADYESFKPWLRAMVEVLIDGMTQREGLGKSGQRVLFCIDEFASLGEMERIATASDIIAGAGVKLLLAVQRLGQLKKHYGEAWQTFIASAGAQIWFGAEEMETREFIERSLGNTEVTIYEDSIAIGRGTSVAKGVSEVYTHTNSLATTDTTGQSRTHADSRSRADGVQEQHSHTDSRNDGTTRGGSESRGTTNTRGERSGRGGASGSNWNYGTNDGRTAGKDYGPYILFEPWEHTTNRGSNSGRNRSRGGSRQDSWSSDTTDSQSTNQVHSTNYSENSSQGYSDTRGGGTSRIDTAGTSDARTDSTSRAQTTGTSDAHGRGTSHVDASIQNQTATRSQRRHVIPLLSALEAKQYLRSFPESDREHAAFPGLALIILSGEPHPFFVRKANHDQDPFFVRKFNPNPVHSFVPFDEQPLLGWQITEAHFFSVHIPEPLVTDWLGVEVTLPQSLFKNAIIDKGMPVLAVLADAADEWHTQPPAYGVKAPVPLKVLNLEEGESRQQGRLMQVRAQTAQLSANWREDFASALWARWFEARNAEIERCREIEAERRRQEAERKRAEQAREAERRRQEAERKMAEQAREAERKRAEQEAIAERRRTEEAQERERIRQAEIAAIEQRIAEQEAKIKAQEGLVADCRAKLVAVAGRRADLWLDDGEDRLIGAVLTIALSCALVAGMVYQSFWGGVGAFIAGLILAVGFLFLVGLLQKLYCEREWGETEEQLSLKASALRSELEGFKKSLESLREKLHELLGGLGKYGGREVLESEICRPEITGLERRIADQEAKIAGQGALVADCRAKLVAVVRRRDRLWLNSEDSRPEWLNTTVLTIPLFCGVLGGVIYEGFWGIVAAFFVGWLLALWFLAVAMFVQKLYCERDWEETERQLSLKASELRSDLEVFEESLKFLRHGLDQLLVARSKYWHKEDLELEISRRKSDLERLDIQINALDRRLESLRSQQQLGLWTSWEGWEKYSGRLVFSYIAIAFIYVLWLDDSHRGDPGGVTWLRGIFAIPLLLNIAWVVFFIQRKIHERSSGWSYSALKEEERELLDEVEPLRDERRPAIYRPLNLLECELRSRAIAR